MSAAGAMAAAGAAKALVGGIFGGDALSSAGTRSASDIVFDASGGRASTGGEETAPRWMPFALAGVALIAVFLIWKR